MQALLQDREALEREKSVLQASLASQQSQLQHIQSTQEQLQQALQESHTEVESLQRGMHRSMSQVTILLKMVCYYSITVCYYWDMSVK